jgi:hypothetical protein
MKVKFSNETKNDFRNYKEHLQKLKKSDTDKYRHINPEESKKKLRDNIGSSIGKRMTILTQYFQRNVMRHGSCHRLVLSVRLRLIVTPNVLNIRLRHALCTTIVCATYGYLIFFL